MDETAKPPAIPAWQANHAYKVRDIFSWTDPSGAYTNTYEVVEAYTSSATFGAMDVSCSVLVK